MQQENNDSILRRLATATQVQVDGLLQLLRFGKRDKIKPIRRGYWVSNKGRGDAA